jgi:endonuclease YncB( thermonuclease family)
MNTKIRFLFCFLAIPVAGLLDTQGQVASDAATKTMTGVIVEVNSGNTILLRTNDNRQIPLYVWGIDCPEINNSTGKRAQKYTAHLVKGEKVTVNLKAKTSDGRVLCRIFFDGNRDLAEELLKEGYAVWVTKLAPDESSYEIAQTNAQDERRGLWKQWLPKIKRK